MADPAEKDLEALDSDAPCDDDNDKASLPDSDAGDADAVRQPRATKRHVLVGSVKGDMKMLSSRSNMGKLGLAKSSTGEDQKKALLWALLASYMPDDVKSIQRNFVHHVEYTLAQARNTLDNTGALRAVSYSVRDRLVERWKDTQTYFFEKDCKRVAYMSMEFLVGRSLQNAIFNLNLKENFTTAMYSLGVNLERIYDEERDAGLGNGGLGRLAACFMDSLATMDYPAWGYGLRYTYGMFFQTLKDGYQVECPDYWLSAEGNPWEIQRLDVKQSVRFGGEAKEITDKVTGETRFEWEGGEVVLAVAYDMPIPGYHTYNTLNIRLWSAMPSEEFDLKLFNEGDFMEAIAQKQRAENITSVLYPNDNTEEGKKLRLKQQYFFVSATIKDLIRRFKRGNQDIDQLPSKVCIQLNDTHPSLSVVELMRILIDYEGLSYDNAWDLCTKVFCYTNHTVLPEALETWPVGLLEHLLPRHMPLIYEINFHFLQVVEAKWPGDIDRLRRMSIIEEGHGRKVRMAHLAMVTSRKINGVAQLHTQLLTTTLFKDFYELWPERFENMTNGVTPRRWIHQANPDLASLISKTLRDETWLLDCSKLSALKSMADDANFQKQWAQVKLKNKQRLADYVEKRTGVVLNTNALFDIQVKRIHEYKRQLMNILSIIYRYRTIKATKSAAAKKKIVPRAILFGGKAAPGYDQAKLIIKLINNVAKVVNNDKDVGDLLKVVFLPNYCVSQAEIIIPASDISQHISTAGMEASGTSNMKFAMNGGLILGTLDGANVEICEHIGEANMFIFGARLEEIEKAREMERAKTTTIDPRFNQVLGMIEIGLFGHPEIFEPIMRALEPGNDFFLVAHDFPAYLDAQMRVDGAYVDVTRWMRMSILSTAGSGYFSSDRTIKEYADKIWGVKPVRRPGPIPVSLDRLSKAGFQDRLPTPMSTPMEFNQINFELPDPDSEYESETN